MKYLNTDDFSSELIKLIKSAKRQLILVSPYLKFHDRIKDLIEYRTDLTIFIIYGKKDPTPAVVDWIRSMPHIKWYFSKNNHAKCYMNEQTCLIGSMNLYEYSQQNNYEMGVGFSREEHPDQFNAVLEDIGIMKGQAIKKHGEPEVLTTDKADVAEIEYSKLTTSKLAAKLNISTRKLRERLLKHGFLAEASSGEQQLTDKATDAGVETKKTRYGKEYWLWPTDVIN